MEKMTKPQMIEFLRGMNQSRQFLANEKKILRNSVETIEEAISRISFARKQDDSGGISKGYSADKIFRVLRNAERDIEEEARSMASQMRLLYEKEDQIDFIWRCIMQMTARDQFLIKEVYVNGELMEKLADRMALSKSYLYKLTKRALDHLLESYNSQCGEATSQKAERWNRDICASIPEEVTL